MIAVGSLLLNDMNGRIIHRKISFLHSAVSHHILYVCARSLSITNTRMSRAAYTKKKIPHPTFQVFPLVLYVSNIEQLNLKSKAGKILRKSSFSESS